MDELELFKQFLEFKKMMEQQKQEQQQQKPKKPVDKVKCQKLEDGTVVVNLTAFNFRIQKYKDNYYMHLKLAPFIKKNSKGVYTIRISQEDVKCIIEAMDMIKKEMDNVVESNQALKQ